MQPEFSLTWVGHATVLIDVGGLRILTDPILTSRVAHLRRRVAPPRLEGVEVVLISHLHMDHLHLRSLRTVVDGARVVETGTHEALVAKGGQYAELYEIQASAYR